MKLKYYLRGLGTGIVVTALIMCVSDKDVKMTETEIRQEAMKLGMVDGTQVLADASAQKEEVEEETGQEITEEALEETSEDETGEPAEETSREVSGNTTEPVEATSQALAEGTAEEPNEDVTGEHAEEPNGDEAEEPAEETNQDETGEPVEKTTETADAEETTEETNREATEEPIGGTGEEIIIVVESGDGSRTLARKLKEAGVIDDVLRFDNYLCANGYDKRICTGNHVVKKGMSDEELAKIFTTRVR